MRRRLPVLACLASLLAGCSLSSDPAADSVGRAARAHPATSSVPRLLPRVPGAPTVEISAPVEPAYDRTRHTVAAGTVNVSFSTTGNHNVNLVGPGLVEPLLWGEPAGAVEEHLTWAVSLRPGTYLFYCSVQGHRAAGMEGRILAR